MKCLISNDQVYIDYARNDIPSLHEKNLFELGEDRMLTTLLLQHFPGMRLSFVPEAMCWTIVPHTLKILLSQRRRWINSTFHNMYELLKVKTMCGICCLSMKTVVVMDLIITMVLPASLAYIVYLAYLFVSEPESIDMFIIIFYGVTFGMQMVSFLIRSRWDYLWWFFIFTFVGIPVFYFLLPIYAFTNMDDFSWGKTRTVAAEEGQQKPAKKMDRADSPDTKPDSLREEVVPKRNKPSSRPSSVRSGKDGKSAGDPRIGSFITASDGAESVPSGTHLAASGAQGNSSSVISRLTGFTETEPSTASGCTPSVASGLTGTSEGGRCESGRPKSTRPVVEGVEVELEKGIEL